MEQATSELISALIIEGIIAEAAGSEKPPVRVVKEKLGGTGTEKSLKPPFRAPSLEKYTDMEALLLLDPIHEVGQTGWPASPQRVEKDTGVITPDDSLENKRANGR